MLNKRFLLIAVLILASFGGSTIHAQDDLGTIPEVAVATEGLVTLATAFDMAGPDAVALLSSEGPFTLFAPIDDAFNTMDANLMNTVLSDPAALQNVLLYHVGAGEWTLEAINAAIDESEEGAAEIPTLLEGESLTAALDDEGNVTINGASITIPDVMASNGIIQGIDAVLVPPVRSYVMEIPAGEPGSEDNPLVLMFVPSEDAETVLAGAEDLAALITEKTGIALTPIVSVSYSAAVEAICAGEADIVALNTFSYVLASARECAEVGVVSVRFGSYYYSGQIITQADSGIAGYEDLAGTVFCRPDEFSTSGWIIPSIAMRANGIDPETDLEVIDAGGHDGVVTAVYNGDCDAGATYVDARGTIEDENPDVKDKVIVIAESAPIPNDTLSYATDMPDEMKANLTAALLEIAADPDNVELLSAVYSWDALIAAEDAFFDDFREQLDAAGIDVESFAE